MRKPALLIAASLLLVSCGGGGATVECSQDYWNGVVGTCLPDGWIEIDSETLRQRGVPEETVAAFQAEEATSGQFPSTAITQERLTDQVSPEDYSSASIRSVAVLPGYELIDTRNVTIDGAGVQIHIFTAQPSSDEPKRRYYQVSTSRGVDGFTITATTPVSISDNLEEQVLTILENFTLQEPTTES